MFVSSCGELQKVGDPCQISKNMLMIEFKNNLADMVTFGKIQASHSKYVCLLSCTLTQALFFIKQIWE